MLKLKKLTKMTANQRKQASLITDYELSILEEAKFERASKVDAKGNCNMYWSINNMYYYTIANIRK
jgi:hypothetical protein